MQNFGNEHQTVKPGQHIAQIILEQASVPPINMVNTLVPTERGKASFGSTDEIDKPHTVHVPNAKVPKLPSASKMPLIPIPTISPNMAAAAKLFSDIQTTFE